jgi:putative ABC transport system permease protein
MFSRALLKDTLREILGTFNRFFSIIVIIALGVGFFMGVKSTAPDMKLTADKYFDETRLMDIHLLSTMGFDEEDIKAIKAQPDFDNVMPSYSADAIMEKNGASVVVKVLSLPDAKDSVGEKLNNPILLSGRMPENPGECVVEENTDQKLFKFELGETIEFEPQAGDMALSDSLDTNKFKVVGFINSPQYISLERGASNIGDGSVSCYIMVPRADFNLPVYTDVYLTVRGLKDVSAFGQHYGARIAEAVKLFEDLGQERADARYGKIIDDAQAEIDAAKAELDKAENDTNNQLSDALAQLEAGQAQIGQAEADKNKRLAEGRQQIDQGKKDLEKAEADLEKGEKDYNKQIADGEAELAAGRAEYEKNKAEYDKQKAEFGATKPEAEQQIADAQAQLDDLNNQIAALEIAIRHMEGSGIPVPQEMTDQLNTMKQQHADGQAQLNAEKAKLAKAERDLAAADKQLKQAKAQLDQGEADLEKSKKDGRAQLDDARSQIDQSKSELAEAEREYQKGVRDAQHQIDSARSDLTAGQSEYDKSKQDAEQQLADARLQISDAEVALAELQKPKWYVQSRQDNPGYSEYADNADRIDAIATIFPVFFLMVAAMVCLTTMTRMVEEQRMQIGTLKALGYGKGAIAGKYFIYSALASLVGSAAGCAVGYWLFPTTIYNAYDMMYSLPELSVTFQWPYAVVGTIAGILCTVVVALIGSYSSLKSNTAALMRPKPPKAGKRIFLERIGFLWSRMGFISKVTARNILRYKARFLMAVLGIAGCTALMLAGFGLKDSISVIVPAQFQEIYSYDTVLGLRNEVGDQDATALKADIEGDQNISSALLARQMVMDAAYGDRKIEVRLFVPDDAKQLPDFITLRHRTDDTPVALPDDGVVITEKMAGMLGVSAGDTIQLKKEETTVEVKVADIVENYVYHYVYMSPWMYRVTYGEYPMYNSGLARMNDPGPDTEKALATTLLEKDDVLSVLFTSSISSDFMDSLKSLDTVVLVLIAAAGCLAFVVVYNLTNINICERQREIATMKVLGFNNREVSNYVFREIFTLTIIGIILGLGLGILLHQMVVGAAEVDMVMFGKNVFAQSYGYSVALTFIFTLLVNFAMYFRLKRISMVESLKSVE